MTFDEFTADVLDRLRADMQSIRNPEGDIHPALFHYFDGEIIRRFKIPFRWFDTRDSKAAMAKAIEAVHTMSRPRYFAWECTTYVIDADVADIVRAEPGQKLTRVADMPGRKEVVTLLTFSHDTMRYFEAEITRDGKNPPSYGEWDELPNAMEVQGYVLGPIMKSMFR